MNSQKKAASGELYIYIYKNYNNKKKCLQSHQKHFPEVEIVFLWAQTTTANSCGDFYKPVSECGSSRSRFSKVWLWIQPFNPSGNFFSLFLPSLFFYYWAWMLLLLLLFFKKITHAFRFHWLRLLNMSALWILWCSYPAHLRGTCLNRLQLLLPLIKFKEEQKRAL